MGGSSELRSASPAGDATEARLAAAGVAGAFSAVVFTVVHHIFISDIWFSLLPMMAAGAACGAMIAWSYTRTSPPVGPPVGPPDAPGVATRRWVAYNAAYVLLFGALGVASVIAFDPVTTMAAVIAANEPPDELFGEALPLTALFGVVSTAVLYAVFGRRPGAFAPILATVVVLVVLLGLNVAVIGLVDIPAGSLYLVAELYALVIVLDAVFAATYLVIVRRLAR